ncbi:MAG: hypothetical protein RLZZ15_4569 [Verrucomicrobiota bacterium]
MARSPLRRSAVPLAVAEVQGLDGPFSFSEKLLQKIWWRGAFDRAAAVTIDGRPVVIGHPGKWNLLGGPDFRGARVAIGGGAVVAGDVELHLQAADWAAHAHARDPAYDGVVLHVVLFPPAAGHVTRGRDGAEIPVVALLPLLHHDLEEYATEEAVESLAGRAGARIAEELAGLPAAALEALLRERAERRWRQKTHFARLRVRRLGWEEACHQTALEILGYRFNRVPMLHVAARWSLAAWRGARKEFADEVHGAEEDAWSVQGVRPANHPRRRLHQYAAWVGARPDWPDRVAALAATLPRGAAAEIAAATRGVRRHHGFTRLRARIAREVCGDAVGGTRFDNLMCDGLLPLAAARAGGTDGAGDSAEFFALWFHWFAGDLPPAITGGLRQLGAADARVNPLCHGRAQGLLGWWLDREPQG